MMESPRRRTPLSDQTNTTTTTPFSAAATQPKPKPLKPYTAMTRTRPTTTCSPKSNSSIGSNLPETVLESDKTHVSETRKDKQKASPEDLLFIDIFHPRQPLGELVKLFANHIGLESAELTLNGPIQQTMVQMCQEAGFQISLLFLFQGPITLRKAVNIDSSDETQSAQTRKDKGKAVLRGDLWLLVLQKKLLWRRRGRIRKTSFLKIHPLRDFLLILVQHDQPLGNRCARLGYVHSSLLDLIVNEGLWRMYTNICEKVGFQTTCNPRRGIEKVINAHRSTVARSCSHGEGSRETWFKVDTSAGDSKSGSFSDPLPLHKKMRWQRHAKPVPSMPPDEAEKLRAQYAEIDAFELPVESESE